MTLAEKRLGSGIARVSGLIAASGGWRRALVAISAGSISVLAFAPFFAAPVLFLTLPAFVWLIDSRADWRSAAIDGWLFAFGFFFFNLVWVGEAFLVEADKFAVLLPFAVTLLPAGLALFWAAAAAACRLVWPSSLARVLVLAIALSIAEWLRGHVLTGLPWNVVGYALTATDELMQGAALVGVYGLTPLVIAIFAAPLVLLADAARENRVPPYATVALVSLAPLAILFAYGLWRLSQPAEFVPGVRLRIVQPSVLQREKWMPEHQRRIFDDHLTLTLTDAAGNRDDADGVTHVIWPEAAMPFLPLEHPEALTAIAEALPDGATLITGAIRRELTNAAGALLPPSQVKTFNGLIAFDDAGRPVERYDKIHLVPFGEYLPLEPLWGPLGLKKLTHGMGAFAAGPSPRPLLDISGLPPAIALVCYEALFPGAIVDGAERPGMMINVTNDGWFGNSTGPRQHLHQARVRAVEEGAPLIRAANNGVSAIIDSRGRMLQRLDMNVRGVIDGPLPAAAGPTPYSRIGDWGFAAILAAFAAAALAMSRRAQG